MRILKILTFTALLSLAGCASNNSYINQRNITLENKVYSVQNNELKQKTDHFNSIKFGIVSDIHNEIEKAEKIAKKFNEEEVDSVIVAGDMSRHFNDKKNVPEEKEIRDSLIPFLETGKPVYVIAGNHETKNTYFKTTQELAGKYNNLFDLATLKYVDLQGTNLFGVSGGSPSPIGGFSVKQEAKSVDKSVFDLDNDPVLMISHMPPRFNHEEAIDCLHYVKLKNGKIIKDRHKGEKAIYEGKAIEKINLRNKGREELTNLIEKVDIEFGVHGHYHMNKGANDFEKNILENIYVEQLFMNPGACQYDMAGILIIKGREAKYNLLKID